MTIPANSVLPAITGTVEVGQTLALSDGTWINAPTSYTYVWLRGGSAISGATTSSYTIVRADLALTIVGRVTATNADGSASADSAATIAVPTTLVVEDGTGIAAADAYASIAFIDEYHDARANSAWAALAQAAKEAAIRKASEYMMQVYKLRWLGVRMNSTENQGLDWPRAYVYTEEFLHGAVGTYPFLVPSNIVPLAIKRACAELALKSATEDLAPDIEKEVTREKVAGIETWYHIGGVQYKRYRAIDLMLAPYLSGKSGASTGLVRS